LLEAEITELQSLMNNKEKRLQELAEAFDRQQAMNALAVYREQLVDGEPCPCCGAQDHPYAATMPPFNASLADELNSVKADFRKCEKELAEKEKKRAVIEIQIQGEDKTKVGEHATVSSLKIRIGECIVDTGLTVESTAGSIDERIKEMEGSIALFEMHQEWSREDESSIIFKQI
jgi:exonuclease SbcC